MNCHTFEARIGDHVDGTLPAPEAAAVEAHLAGCPSCRALAADFTIIRSAARTLEPHVPPAHVWHRVAAAAAAPRWRAFLGIPLAGWRHAAATAMVTLLAAGLWWVGGRLSPDAAPPLTTASTDYLVPADVMSLATQEHYASAITRLEEVATSGRDLLDVQTAGVIDAGMLVIDEAIDESRAAVASQPQSELAQDSLVQALRSKVTLLQATMTLIGEMRKGSGESAGRIVAESNR